MSRNQLLALGAVNTISGSITTGGSVRDVALLVGLIVGTVLAVGCTRDLHRLGWTWQAPVIGVSNLAATLVGLVLYALASRRPVGS